MNIAEKLRSLKAIRYMKFRKPRPNKLTERSKSDDNKSAGTNMSVKPLAVRYKEFIALVKEDVERSPITKKYGILSLPKINQVTVTSFQQRRIRSIYGRRSSVKIMQTKIKEKEASVTNNFD